MPTSCAISAWCARCRNSPWTGRKNFGFTRFSISFSSSELACPEACTRWSGGEEKRGAGLLGVVVVCGDRAFFPRVGGGGRGERGAGVVLSLGGRSGGRRGGCGDGGPLVAG